MLDEADQFAHEVFSDELLEEITALIPDEWLVWNHTQETPDEIRGVYLNLLKTRLRHSQNFLNTAKDARG